MNHTTETIATLDTSLAPLRRRRHRRRCQTRRREGQRSMWAVAVVMLHEDVEDPEGCTNQVSALVRTVPTGRCQRAEA